MQEITEKVNKWFDSQYTELEKNKRQNTAKMLRDWVLIEKRSLYWQDWNGKGKKELSYGIKVLKNQKQRTEEKFTRDGWYCGAEFKPTPEYYPFHAEETENYLALCWVRHIYKGEG